ncbi:sugar phosphate isomerase/epimerase [Dyadobacter jejuensis]|uniref:Sugar phosphate isomerase/epimerase n=1 Tax=Dyadobacter jejuensis TaxID=1082580 RepID=A0A316AIZ1_9BACT|nr:sugar phosphate isomerase/epimerase family protein [Dyadobacter jejuensis]PWJ57552.1 sugar phosphate isomerase/epimerase [Dyadobacter jejuensis]
MDNSLISRRDFIATAATLAALPSLAGSSAWARGSSPSITLGVFAAYQHAAYLQSLGFGYIEEAVGRFLLPSETEAPYYENRDVLQQEGFPIKSYVVLLPSAIKTVGPQAQHQEALARTQLALRRAKECGSSYIVFGSGGARNIPEDFNRHEAKAQHIALCRQMAPMAEKYGITIAIEPLNRGETNFINSLAEGVEIVEAVKSPRVKLLCDIYHMLKEDEPASEITKYGKHIVHCHIAEKAERTPPGVMGDDFRPYLSALKQTGYRGGLSIECFHYDDFSNQIRTGIAELQKQINEV